ncbi:MAG TPA: roadblock/LC7 domain-containing protein [Verrucomicrobiae bacterium]
MPNTMKIKFAGLLRSWFHYFEDKEIAPASARPVAARAPVLQETVAERPASSTQKIFVPPATPANPNEIQLPLQPILAALAMELRAKIMSVNTSGMTIAIPVEKVLAQLATGSVKISFGELRQLASGVFAHSGGEHDAKAVVLPLNQILAQINPTLLARRSAQKKVEVTDEVSSPFDTRGEGLRISSEPPKAPKAPAPPPPLPRIATIAEEPVSSLPVRPAPNFTARAVTPVTPTYERQVKPQTENGSRNGANGAHKAGSFDPAFSGMINSAPQISLEQPVLAPLNALAESWPESLRLEIAQLNLSSARIALPANLVEPALKRGRVIFSWRDLRSWIKPTPPNVSVHDGVELELPLKVLAPLFFSRPQNGAGRKKVSVAEEIPNLFFGFPQPANEPEPTRPSVAGVPLPDTNFFTRGNQPETSDSEFKRKGGTDFLSRGATPADIVSRAMGLPGVAGAVIALPDGLKVASLIPADLNGDTLAAFIPQIFARVNQSSRELRMGDVNNLSFTVGNVPWKIFRVNAVYFAAFGRANESLPTAQLAALASELDHKKQ